MCNVVRGTTFHHNEVQIKKLDALSQARLFSWNIAPLLDHRLLDLPWVGAGSGADLLGDVNTLLSGLEQRHQLGDVLALLLWLQVAGLLGNLDFKGKRANENLALL